MSRSPFRKANGHSQKAELNGLFGIGCYNVVDEEYIPKGRKLSGLDECPRTRVMDIETA